MTPADRQYLRDAAQRAMEVWDDDSDDHEPINTICWFQGVCTPTAILALLAEGDADKARAEMAEALNLEIQGLMVTHEICFDRMKSRAEAAEAENAALKARVERAEKAENDVFAAGLSLCDKLAALKAENAALRERVARMEAETADLRQSVVAFGGPWAVKYAKDHGLPPGHIFAEHYDILARAGARMDAFTRVAHGGPDA